VRREVLNGSDAAQAARCLDYPVQFHLNLERIGTYKVVVPELHADWVDMASMSPGRDRGTANFTGPLARHR
jgi:hypothetical protein